MQNGNWPVEDQWLYDLISTQHYLELNDLELKTLLDHKWWNLVSEAVNGIDEPFLRKQWATIAVWLNENPRRRPTHKGWKRFVRGWLERAQERERKTVQTVKRGWK